LLRNALIVLCFPRAPRGIHDPTHDRRRFLRPDRWRFAPGPALIGGPSERSCSRRPCGLRRPFGWATEPPFSSGSTQATPGPKPGRPARGKRPAQILHGISNVWSIRLSARGAARSAARERQQIASVGCDRGEARWPVRSPRRRCRVKVGRTQTEHIESASPPRTDIQRPWRKVRVGS
jgi:hypothetical protein